MLTPLAFLAMAGAFDGLGPEPRPVDPTEPSREPVRSPSPKTLRRRAKQAARVEKS